MMRAAALVLPMQVLMACASNAVPNVACSSDDACPFEQCCVQGVCVDPGPIGGCTAVDGGQSLLSAETDTLVAGSTTQLTVQLRDIYGRPVPGVAPVMQVTSACGDCNAVSLIESATDAHGVVHAAFSSTVAEDKQLTALFDGGATNAVTIHVIPDVAVSVGFANAIADTLMFDQLADVVLTRLDQYGNPDAPMADGSTTTAGIMVSLAVNGAGMVLRGPSGVALAGDASPVTLSTSRITVNNITLTHPGYRLTLVATPPVGSTLTSSQSQPFTSIAPRFTTSDPNPLHTSAAATLTWSADPTVGTSFSDDRVGPLDVVSPYEFTPPLSPLHVRLASKIATRGLDVEVAPFGNPGDFTSPRLHTSAGPAIVHFGAFSNGDILVTARLAVDLMLGGTDVSTVNGAGYEAMVARFDPTLETLAWVVLLYGANENGAGATITLTDSVIASDDAILVAAQTAGVSGGWQYEDGGVKRCVFGGPATSGPLQSTVARINGSGVVTGCVAIRDSAGGDARVPAIASTSQYNVVSVRATESIKVVKGTAISVDKNTTLVQPDGALSTVVSTPTATPDTGCSAMLGILLPFADDFTLAAPAPVITGLMFDPQALQVDADTTTLLWGGGGCGSTKPLENGGTGTVMTGRLDGMVMHVDLAAAAGSRLTLLWQSNDVSTDEVTAVQRIDANVIAIAGTFVGTLNGGGARVFTSPTVLNGYVAGITRGTLQTMRWGFQLQSPQVVTPQAFVQGPDRLVLAAISKDAIHVIGTDHVVLDGDSTQVLPVGIYLELSRAGAIRWSSPAQGAMVLSRPLMLPEGAVLAAASGNKGTVVVGPVDASPLKQFDVTPPGIEPVTYVLTPWDFIERDVLVP